MFRLTMVLALVIFAVLVLVPRQDDPAETGMPPADPPGGPAPSERAETAPGTGDALREMPDGRLVLVTTTGEELTIDRVVEPVGEPVGDDTTVVEADADRPSDVDAGAADTAGATAAVGADATGAARLRVTGDRVNLRAGPSTDDEILTALTLGTEVELIERVGDGWANLRVPGSGLTGYMSDDFLEPAN